jgi:hypothetical protein
MAVRAGTTLKCDRFAATPALFSAAALCHAIAAQWPCSAHHVAACQ